MSGHRTHPKKGEANHNANSKFVIGGRFPPEKAVERRAADPTTRKGDRITPAPKTLYPSSSQHIIVLFDLRLPGTAERLDRERAAWQAQSDVEALDENHFVLLVRPDGARRLAA